MVIRVETQLEGDNTWQTKWSILPTGNIFDTVIVIWWIYLL